MRRISTKRAFRRRRWIPPSRRRTGAARAQWAFFAGRRGGSAALAKEEVRRMSWNLSGSYAETCSCELMCPCNLSFDHGATYDFCRATLAFNIRTGKIEGTDVGG